MPYIEPIERPYLDEPAHQLGIRATTAGQLNYGLTKAILDYLGETPRYADFSEVVGTMILATLELWWRKIRPYEDIKCQVNGDVYGGHA